MQRHLTTVALMIGLGMLLLGGAPTEALRPPGDEGPPIDDVPPEDPAPPLDAPPDCGPLSPVLRVTRTTPASCFIEALKEVNNLVLLEHDVELDLTGYANILIAQGVTLTSAAPPPPPIGHAPPSLAAMRPPDLPRDPWAPHPAEYTVARDARHRGPRVYTRTPPTAQPDGSSLFDIRCFPPNGPYNDGVRIAGFRLHGPTFGPQFTDDFGIHIDGCINIEISNMEIAGWGGAAIRVQDWPWEAQPEGRITRPSQVRIVQNFLHHNQHPSQDGKATGYGVEVNIGAWAEIAENVFDFNRHAIAASGDAGGYDARRNLVLKGGGFHNSYFVVGDWYTHQFDIHGTGPNGFGGQAGTQFWFANNTFQYGAGPAIKVRGRPRERVEIRDNVFVHPGLEKDRGADAIHLEDRDDRDVIMIGPNNAIDVDSYGRYGVCDFDGDTRDDLFLATGATWWYASGGKMHWTYLKEATERLHEVGLGDFDGDGRCDVFAVHRAAQQWAISPGGSGPWTPLPGTYDLPFETLGFGHFNGDEDRVMDIFHRAPDGQWFAISPGLYDWRPLQRSDRPLSALRFGDFNGDHITDVLAVEEGRWAVSWSGLTVWEALNPALADPLAALLIADMDADGRDDLVRYTPTDGFHGLWEISWGGRTGWAPLATFTWEPPPPPPGEEWRPRPALPAPAEDVHLVMGRFDTKLGADVLAVDTLYRGLDAPYRGRWGYLFSYGATRWRTHNMYEY